MNIRSLSAAVITALALPLAALAQSGSVGNTQTVGVSNTTNLGNGGYNTAECSATTGASASGTVTNNNVSGGGTVGTVVGCSNTIGYANPYAYVSLETGCQSGTVATGEGSAGANGLMVCADVSTGTSCSATVGSGTTSQYGGAGSSAGVGAGGEGAGLCGGMTFTAGVASIAMCGTLAFQVGVDLCVNGSVNYGNIINRAEPFASRAVAQAAKCAASGTAANQCVFTTGDLMANAAAPYYKRTKAFFDSSNKFAVNEAKAVWNDARSVKYRGTNYAKSTAKYVGNDLKNTSYNAAGNVVNASNQLVDTGAVAAAAIAGGAVGITNTVGRSLGGIGRDTNRAFGGMGNTGRDMGRDLGKSLDRTLNNTSNSIGNAAANTGNAALDTGKDLGNAAVNTGKDAGNAVVNAGKDTGNAISKTFKKIKCC